MATTQQYALRWNNFHSTLSTGFSDLLEKAEMVDVTIAVDGRFLQAHKIVLSICSPYFKQMFKVSPCKHPIVILKDVCYEYMKDILEFMYKGEVSVLQENLSSFLRTAELLQIKGLSHDDSNESSSSRKDDKLDCDDSENDIYNQMIETTSDVELPQYPPTSPEVTPSPQPAKRPTKTANSNGNTKRSKVEPHNNQPKPVKPETDVATPKSESNNCDYTETPKDYSEKSASTEDEGKEVKTIWENISNIGASSTESASTDQGKADVRIFRNGYQCQKCLKRFSRRDHLKTHEKNIHGSDAGPFKCGICGQLYKNTESLRKHIAKFHIDGSLFNPEKGHVYCPYCCRKFVNRYNLKVHIRDKHEASSTFLDCEICGKTMRNQSCLRVHMYHHRKQQTEAGSVEAPRLTYQ